MPKDKEKYKNMKPRYSVYAVAVSKAELLDLIESWDETLADCTITRVGTDLYSVGWRTEGK